MKFIDLLDWLFGCSHRRTTFPRSTRLEMYVSCLDCGRRLTYDWAAMRITRPKFTWHAKPGAALVLVLAGMAGQVQSQTLAANGQTYRIAVNVDLVVLHATMRDRKGQSVEDLRSQDVAVYEDGVRQTIRLFVREDIPVTVGLVVDHSGSMGNKLPSVIAAARAFVAVSNPADEMFVINFNEVANAGLPPETPFTNDAGALARAIANAPTSGTTALYDAIDLALQGLQAGTRDKKVLIVISDGSDNASSRTLAEVVNAAGHSNTLIYTIGVFEENDPDRNEGVLKRLARTTGGEAYFPRKLDEVVAICEQVARDIRQQYTIGYLSANTARPGSYRRIRVDARAPGSGKLTVRTRSGYFDRGVQPVDAREEK